MMTQDCNDMSERNGLGLRSQRPPVRIGPGTPLQALVITKHKPIREPLSRASISFDNGLKWTQKDGVGRGKFGENPKPSTVVNFSGHTEISVDHFANAIASATFRHLAKAPDFSIYILEVRKNESPKSFTPRTLTILKGSSKHEFAEFDRPMS